jgi:hypothetical protein
VCGESQPEAGHEDTETALWEMLGGLAVIVEIERRRCCYIGTRTTFRLVELILTWRSLTPG